MRVENVANYKSHYILHLDFPQKTDPKGKKKHPINVCCCLRYGKLLQHLLNYICCYFFKNLDKM